MYKIKSSGYEHEVKQVSVCTRLKAVVMSMVRGGLEYVQA